MSQGCSFDDVLLVPQLSSLNSRSDVSLETSIGGVNFSLPIISSPMDTVTNGAMAAAMACAGGLGIIHRGQSAEDQAKEVRLAYELISSFTDRELHVGAAIGVKETDLARLELLVAAGATFICIDVAHGHHMNVARMIKLVRENAPKVKIIAGNVATYQGAAFLDEAGADAIRVGIGNGSICSTRLNCGHGVPQVEALDEIGNITSKTIISDGGCRYTGDIVKALAIGANAVMLGSMLAGTTEAPGEDIEINGELCRVYRGMASHEAQRSWADQVGSVEGISSYIKHKGSVLPLLHKMRANLQAGLSYSGAGNLVEFQQKAIVTFISQAAFRESTTHIELESINV